MAFGVCAGHVFPNEASDITWPFLCPRLNAKKQFDLWFAEEIREAKRVAWEEGCLAGGNRKHHTNMTEDQAEKTWPNPYKEE